MSDEYDHWRDGVAAYEDRFNQQLTGSNKAKDVLFNIYDKEANEDNDS